MKAMILAAGLGTRLLPLTKEKPKPLFPILGRPLIDILIRRLQASGCEAVVINTHYLSEMIDDFLNGQDYRIPVQTSYEPAILGTGGGIKNVEGFWDRAPFLVTNADIFTNIDIREVYRFHLSHRHPVTLVLHECARFDNVWVDSNNHVRGFGQTAPSPPQGLDSEPLGAEALSPVEHYRQLAFTGIHVIDPVVLSFIPKKTCYDIIDAYCEMIRSGLTVKAIIARNHYWHDVGTLGGYREAARIGDPGTVT